KNSDRLLKIAANTSPGVAESSSYFEESGRQIIRISALTNKLEASQQERLLVREKRRNLYNAIFNWVLIFLAFASLAAIVICAYLFRKTELFTKKEKEELSIRSHVSSLAVTMTDDLQLQEAGRAVLNYLSSHFSILASKIFLLR